MKKLFFILALSLMIMPLSLFALDANSDAEDIALKTGNLFIFINNNIHDFMNSLLEDTFGGSQNYFSNMRIVNVFSVAFEYQGKGYIFDISLLNDIYENPEDIVPAFWDNKMSGRLIIPNISNDGKPLFAKEDGTSTSFAVVYDSEELLMDAITALWKAYNNSASMTELPIDYISEYGYVTFLDICYPMIQDNIQIAFNVLEDAGRYEVK